MFRNPDTVSEARLALKWRRFDEAEVGLCRRMSHVRRSPPLAAMFRVVSRLGDGVFWYALMAVLPLLYGAVGLAASLRMLGCAAVSLVVYRLLKRRLVRERPYVWHPEIGRGAAALDRFSFPSGHTLHAVCFTTVALAELPELAWLLLPFTSLVAASRVVLGLHYPSDVLAGAAIGYLIARLGTGLPV
jgi:undecaprenyl-diphosphatase